MSILKGWRTSYAAAVVALASLAFAAPSAHALWGPGAQLASVGAEQANAPTTTAAVSGDGRYVAFQTRARNIFPPDVTDPPGFARQGGIFRKDTQTGNLELVAGGDLVPQAGGTPVIGAQSPSISADGRYVSFRTREALTALDTNTNFDVYVRDVSAPFGEPAAFQLASAKHDGDEPPTYGTGPVAGSDAIGPAGISGDGQRVLFRTAAMSDLAGPGTPAGNLFVRDMGARTITLVTASSESGAPAAGAAGAALSADGTAVAWTSSGAAASTQANFLPGDTPGESFSYYLWRRIGSSSARRITGWTDPDDPGCTAEAFPIRDDPLASGPCYGPLIGGEDFIGALSSSTPSLSADGNRVAFLTDQAPRVPPDRLEARQLDLYFTDMSPGVTRKAGTLELTRESGTDGATSNPIENAWLSADGARVFFISARSKFVLSSPRLVDPEVVTVGPSNVYQVDLGAMRIERVTTSHSGGEAAGAASSVTSSADGRRVAFVSGGDNLTPGDSNGSTDAFSVSEPPRGGVATTNEPPFNPSGAPAIRSSRARLLRVQAVRSRRGRVRLTVGAPGAGLVRALARERRGSTRSRRQLRLVARSAKRFTRAGTATLVLRPARRYGKVIRKRGLPATIRVSFAPAGGGLPVMVTKPAVFRR